MTPKRRRTLLQVLGPALLLAGALFLPGHGAYAQADPSVAHVDGYLSADGRCLMLRQHDGQVLALRGDTRGLASGDHVRLEGRFAADPGCGAAGFDLTLVQAIWGDDNHRTVYYDHLNGEPFVRWAERTGHVTERRAYGNGSEQRGNGYGSEQRGNGSGYERSGERRSYDRGDAAQYPERYDRNGRYVYSGPHRRVTLVGRIHESAGACPTLHTSTAVFALDGNLGDYQAGDRVHLSGYLYDGDPNAPCGGPTVVVRSIRGR
jgi:hypothetical protein